MKLYNLTTTAKKYGRGGIEIVLPASNEAGVRGPAVDYDAEVKAAIALDHQKFEADRTAGKIEFVNE